jgi:hypothetical protein
MQMGIHFEFKGLIWIPAFAGMTASVENQGVSQLNFSAPKSQGGLNEALLRLAQSRHSLVLLMTSKPNTT